MNDFIANNIDRMAPIGYGDLHEKLSTAKVGQLAFKLLSSDIDTRDRELEPPKLCSMISNANFPLRDRVILNTGTLKLESKMKSSFKLL